MAQDKKSVLLYCDIIHVVSQLSDEEAGQLFKHYLEYINDQNPEPPSKLIQIVFEPIKQNLKRDLKKWQSKSLKNSEIAKERWSKRTDANAYERIKSDANHADKDTVTVTVTDTVTDIVKDKDIKRSNKFIIPTLQEVQNYCLERKNKIDPESFIDHYQAKGWIVGKSKMKDWKACVRTWEKYDFNKAKPTIKHTIEEGNVW